MNDSGGLVGTLESAQTEGPDVTYIDVFKDLSLCNHRLYRQGRTPMVRVGFIGPFSNDISYATVAVQTLPNTWPVRKAHQLALKKYLSATKEERRATGQARWHDFKVFFEDGHRTGTTLNPVGITTTDSEWNYSEIYNHTTSANIQFKMIGPTTTDAYGIVDQYDKSEDQDIDQPRNPGNVSPYEGLTADREQENMDNLLDEGDNPPYNPTNLQTQLLTYAIGVGSGKSDKMVSEWFPVPCGLLKVMAQVISTAPIAADTTGSFFVEVMPGDYKGVHATPMGLKL